MSGGVTAAVLSASEGNGSTLSALCVGAFVIVVALIVLNLDSILKWLDRKLGIHKNRR
jgi:hypothetical protein